MTTAATIPQTIPATLAILADYPNVSAVVASVLKVWPEHERYCLARFSADDGSFLARTEALAALVVHETGSELELYCSDYRWMCERFLEDELYFRRNKSYRLSTFKDAYEQVYSDDAYMSKYVRGILISQVIWAPHAQAIDFFRTDFLPSIPQGADYLEIGPGHGLFLFFASQQSQLANLVAWDVSPSSIAEARSALSRLGVTREISIVEQDVLKAPPQDAVFQAAVISEVLEHLERPDLALQSLYSALKPGGRLFINAPVNSPAPDHIYLWRTPEEFVEFVEAQGFEIDEARFLPVTGATLKQARKHALSISCVLIARRPKV